MVLAYGTVHCRYYLHADVIHLSHTPGRVVGDMVPVLILQYSFLIVGLFVAQRVLAVWVIEMGSMG